MHAKSAETRTRILDSAMELFRRQGFEETTMREIAAEAGVATGAAYYYFESKDAIVLAFYDQSQQELEPLIDQAIAGAKGLKERLGALLEAKLRYFEPNRRLLAALASHADPEHPLSPFGARTREIRERDVASFARALHASGIRVARDLEPYLPRILWMYQMGLILFWIYDRSPAQASTRTLIGKSAAIVERLVKLAAFPLMRPVHRMVVDLMRTVMEES
ncbi:MAG: TetR family transcriptional regulator [Bryobacteraceae bacterium]